MNSDLLLVLGALIACVGLFIANKPRMDVVALLVIVILPLTGIISMPEALAGFSDTNAVLIAALFVIGEGLTRTGIAYRLSDHLIGMSGTSEARLLVLLMLAVAGLGSVMSSTGVVAIFVPVALNVAERMGVHPRRLMMALAYAGLISGMLTLVGTAPNMVVDGAVRDHGFQGFNFFSFTPFGIAVLVIGVAYMLIARRWLSVGDAEKPSGSRRRNLLELIRDYQLSGREYRLRLRPESPLVGRTLRELQEPKDRYGATVVCIERHGRLGTELLDPTDDTELRAGDVGLIDVRLDPTTDPASAYETLGLEPLPLRGSYFTDHSRAVGMAEILLPPDSTLIGKSIAELSFRRKYGLSVIGLRRGTNPLNGSFLEEDPRAGDILLVIGSWRAIRALEAQFHDFLLLTLPTEIDQVAPAINQAPYALLSLGVMVFLMVTGIVPNVIAALTGCLMMGFFRCIDGRRLPVDQLEDLVVDRRRNALRSCIGAHRRGRLGGQRPVASRRRSQSARVVGEPLCADSRDRPVYLQYRHNSADGADRAEYRQPSRRVTLPLCNDRRTGVLGSVHDADIVAGQHLGSGAGPIQLRRFCKAWRSLHDHGAIGNDRDGSLAVSTALISATGTISIVGRVGWWIV